MNTETPRCRLMEGIWDQDIDTHPDESYKFTHANYECEIRRSKNTWTYCAYVQLPDTHPDFYKDQYEIDFDEGMEPHGCLSYGNKKGKFGIDFAHGSDMIPKQSYSYFIIFNNINPFSHYWTFNEVKQEVEKLADQFKKRELIN